MGEKREPGAWRNVYGNVGQGPARRCIEIPLNLIDPWTDENGKPQPFKPYSQEMMREMVESIRAHGLYEPIRVRPRNGRFQCLSGHNRCTASRMAGLRTIPAVVEEVDDDQAILILVDSNLIQRKVFLPSEKAKAYRLRLEAMKRQPGRPKEGCTSEHYRSDEALAKSSKESARQIQRFIRLTYLIDPLLDLVDEGGIGLIPGVELSYLAEPDQRLIQSIMDENGIRAISGQQVQKLRNTALTEEAVLAILGVKKQQKSVLFHIKSDMSHYPQKTVSQLKKDPEYSVSLQKLIDEFTAQYIREHFTQSI